MLPAQCTIHVRVTKPHLMGQLPGRTLWNEDGAFVTARSPHGHTIFWHPGREASRSYSLSHGVENRRAYEALPWPDHHGIKDATIGSIKVTWVLMARAAQERGA